jgi:hypothetical protein
MTTLYAAMEDAVLVIRERAGGWKVTQHLQDVAPQCLAADPGDPERLYVGSADQGVWRTLDGARTWAPVGRGVVGANVTAVAVAPGPTTHHVRWIAVDPHDPRHLYVAIEAGALIQSADGGDTWTDRAPDGPYDTHTLALHPHAPGRLYSAAGDGYFESRDDGRTWESPEAGLRHGYLFGVAVDPEDPDVVVVSAASGPGRAYSAPAAATYIYLRRGNGAWTQIHDGLPEPKGTTISVFATHRDLPHVVYAANNRGLFRSPDAGASWEPLPAAPWPERLLTQAAQGLAVHA